MPGDRVVLGPATDGGYYLIGLKRAHARLFADIPWSTAAVLDTTRLRAQEIGLATRLLAPWYDVDDAASFETLLDELRDGVLPFAAPALAGGPAAATRQCLRRHPELAKRLERAMKAAPGA